MTYFYDYFAKEYRQKKENKLFPAPAAIFQMIKQEEIKNCRTIIKNAFASYHNKTNTELLERLLKKYQQYIVCQHDKHIKDRYNAFVYWYIVEDYVENKAIAAKLGVVKETIYGYINRCIDEMLMLCMGIPAAKQVEDKKAFIHMLVDNNKLFSNMAGEYVLSFFLGEKEKAAVKQARQLTKNIIEQLTDGISAYSKYCNDKYTPIDTDIRKAEILKKCLEGVPVCSIAEEYGCCESTIYFDIRENEKRLAAMIFQ